jgi:hypothetical protein
MDKDRARQAGKTGRHDRQAKQEGMTSRQACMTGNQAWKTGRQTEKERCTE